MMMAGYAGQVFVQIVEAEDAAMAPLLPQGARAFVDATAYWADPPRPGRVVFLRAPEGRLLRHLVAQPGDTVEIRRGRLLRNDVPCDGREHSLTSTAKGDATDSDAAAQGEGGEDAASNESKPASKVCYFRFQGEPEDFGPLTLAENEYFVLAEDVAALDSRAWGPVAREAIYGIALFTVADDFSFEAITTPAPDLPAESDESMKGDS